MKTRNTAVAMMVLAFTTGLAGNLFAQKNVARTDGNVKRNSSSGRQTWEEAVRKVTDPKGAVSLVRHNIRYEEDLGDTWIGGRETWERGSGDCEDMAAAVVDLLKAAGLATGASVMVFSPERGWTAHAVAVGTWQGKLWMASNGRFQFVKTLEDAKREVAKDMGWRHQKITAAPLVAYAAADGEDDNS